MRLFSDLHFCGFLPNTRCLFPSFFHHIYHLKRKPGFSCLLSGFVSKCLFYSSSNIWTRLLQIRRDAWARLCAHSTYRSIMPARELSANDSEEIMVIWLCKCERPSYHVWGAMPEAVFSLCSIVGIYNWMMHMSTGFPVTFTLNNLSHLHRTFPHSWLFLLSSITASPRWFSSSGWIILK